MLRVTTLKAGRAGIANVIDYYAGLAEDHGRDGGGRGPVDYYLDPDEPPGRWWGDGRHAVGLGGEVVGDQLRRMLEGRHPDTGQPLGRGFGNKSARGFDATFSVPKSVSVLWALSADPFVRAEVLAAHGGSRLHVCQVSTAGAVEIIRGGDVIAYLGFNVTTRDWAAKNGTTIEKFLAGLLTARITWV